VYNVGVGFFEFVFIVFLFFLMPERLANPWRAPPVAGRPLTDAPSRTLQQIQKKAAAKEI